MINILLSLKHNVNARDGNNRLLKHLSKTSELVRKGQLRFTPYFTTIKKLRISFKQSIK